MPTKGTESQMTVKYLQNMSTMLATTSTARKEGLKRHFSVEWEILKLMFAFDHIYVGYITYQYALLNNLLRKDNSIVNDFITNGHSASCSRDSCSTIHGDLVTEHFKKKWTKLLCPSPKNIVLTFISWVNKWIKSSHFTARCERCCGRN